MITEEQLDALHEAGDALHVKRNTGFGMTSSIALCREAGFDPDEIVGNEESEEVCDG